MQQQKHHPPDLMVRYGHHDHGPGLAAESSADDGKMMTKMLSWQRVKWTDHMVKLLILVVYYIGDENNSSEGNISNNDPSAAKKKAAGVVNPPKKGKWKAVSRAMMERGFFVSPQQCEDKFNDLNKRYKRVNEILGKGTACTVVENQALLEKMDHLTPEMKEEVKKLLNSKHLFFREMCAYHNSCNHGDAATRSSPKHSPEPAAAEPSHASVGPNLDRDETEGSKLTKGGSGEEEDYYDDDDDDENEEVVEGGSGGLEVWARGRNNVHEDDNADGSSRKRQRHCVFLPSLVQELSNELMNVIQDGSKSPIEKRVWMRTRMVQLEEQQLASQSEAFELKKQRLKWQKFSRKKAREMERERLSNERMRLENERMVLLIRQKQLELFNLQHNNKHDPSAISG